MKAIIVGLWAVLTTVGAGYAVAALQLSGTEEDGAPRLEGLRYTSLPTMSVPVIENGRVEGYAVVRMVYTADSAILRALSAKPDAFISDEVFRALYSRAEMRAGQLARIDLEAFAEETRANVNARMGDEVVQDLLIDGLNYVSAPSNAPSALPRPTNAARQGLTRIDTPQRTE